MHLSTLFITSIYNFLIQNNVKPENARSVLPNATKTEIITTYNLAQWRHVFEERALNKKAQKEIKIIMQNILIEFSKILPDFFKDQMEILKKQN